MTTTFLLIFDFINYKQNQLIKLIAWNIDSEDSKPYFAMMF